MGMYKGKVTIRAVVRLTVMHNLVTAKVEKQRITGKIIQMYLRRNLKYCLESRR